MAVSPNYTLVIFDHGFLLVGGVGPDRRVGGTGSTPRPNNGSFQIVGASGAGQVGVASALTARQMSITSSAQGQSVRGCSHRLRLPAGQVGGPLQQSVAQQFRAASRSSPSGMTRRRKGAVALSDGGQTRPLSALHQTASASSAKAADS
jgi:hypothetical protein